MMSKIKILFRQDGRLSMSTRNPRRRDIAQQPDLTDVEGSGPDDYESRDFGPDF